MTLFQLLQAYDFDEIMATVNAMFPGTAQYRPQLQQAYDLLLGMNPVESKKNIRYKLLHDADDDISYMGADDANFHTTWEVCLGKQVVREKGVDLSDQEARRQLSGQCGFPRLAAPRLSTRPRRFSCADRQSLHGNAGATQL